MHSKVYLFISKMLAEISKRDKSVHCKMLARIYLLSLGPREKLNKP